MESTLPLMSEGIEEAVQIPMRCMLVSVMQSLESPSPAIFECRKVADGVFEATVKIDVSTTRVSTDRSVTVKELSGSPCSTPELAVSSAVEAALVYLASSHYVEVKDHSDRVAEHFPVRTNWMTASKLIDAVKKVLAKMSGSLDSFSKLRMELEVNGMSEKKNGVQTQIGQIYFEIEKNLAEHIGSYSTKMKDLKHELAIFEGVLEKDHEEKYNEGRIWRLKPHYQVAYVTEKAILAYLMSYLGWEEPTYGTKYVHDRGFKGHVTLAVPDTMKDRFGDKITLPASYAVTRAREAEELAAFQALCFIEDNMKVKPVDLNYQVRCKAVENHKLVVKLIENCHGLLYKVRKVWKNMNNCMLETCSYYAQDYNFNNREKLNVEDEKKFHLVTIGFQGTVDQSLMNYNTAVEEIRNLDECQPVNI